MKKEEVMKMEKVQLDEEIEYQGQFINEKKNGFGILTFISGEK